MALDVKRLAGDFGFAIVAQAVGLLVGFANTLLLPKLLTVETYGFWQLFLFYSGYIGIFGLGIVDGAYLILGGKRRSELDRSAVSGEFWCCTAIQLAVCAVLVAIGCIPGMGEDRSAVLFGVAIYLVLYNCANFLGYLFQAIGETRRYSVSIILESIVFFCGMFALILFGVQRFEPYVAAYLAARIARLCYCLWYARDILAVKPPSLPQVFRESFGTARVGVKLLVSNLATLLIVGFSRFIIDLEWGIEDFAVVSLALALVNFFMNFTSQAAMVLFPALRRVEKGELQALFVRMRDSLSLLLPVVYVLYVPAAAFLEAWLPRYAAAIELFALLLPLCVFNGKMDVVGMTMLKVMREEGMLLRINVITGIVSVAGGLVGAYAIHSIPFILGWTVLCVIVRCVYTERFVSDRLELAHGWINLGSVVVTIVATLGNTLLGPVWAEIVAVSSYLVYLGIFKNETNHLLALAQGLRQRKRRNVL